eukprot:gene19263-38533_t
MACCGGMREIAHGVGSYARDQASEVDLLQQIQQRFALRGRQAGCFLDFQIRGGLLGLHHQGLALEDLALDRQHGVGREQLAPLGVGACDLELAGFGGMRQAGVLAAAGSYALTHQVDRLAQDHALARQLAQGLSGIAGLVVEAPQTNIVFVDLVGPAKERAPELMAFLAARGILTTGLYRLRFVAHLDVDAAGLKVQEMAGIEHLGLFIVAGLLLNLTPGPDVLYIVTHALRSGARTGIMAGLGITAGCFVHTFAAALGVGALLATSASAFGVLKWAGAAYLLTMGVKLLLSRAGASPLAAAAQSRAPA